MRITFAKPAEEIVRKINNLFPATDCFIKVSPGDVILPQKYESLAESIRNLPVYEDDTWLVSYPRTGSTWAQEMLWLLCNKMDFDGAKQFLQIRCPMLELSALFSEDHYEWVTSMGNTVDCVRNMPRPRLVRTHLPWDLLPKDLPTVRPKIVYTARNPKDLCVSFYHYCKLMHGLNGGFEDFCDLFLNDSTPMGPYWNHVLPFWQKRNDSNILFLKYEEMSRDLAGVVQKCADFLKVGYEMSEDDLQKACEHLQFDRMQSNPAVNLDHLLRKAGDVSENKENESEGRFIRKGKTGDWKNTISPELCQRFDCWIRDHFEGTGLDFEYE